MDGRALKTPSPGSVAAMLALAAMWGLSIPITKLGLETTPPLTLTAMRFAVAAPLLFVFTLGRQPPSARALLRLAALGALGIGIGQVAQALGVRETSASVGTIVSATIPLFVVVFAALRLKQPVTGRQKVGLLAAFAGIALIAFGHGHAAAQASSLSGLAWMLVSALAVATYYVWSLELTHEHGTAAVAAWSTLFGLIALSPAAGLEMWREPVLVTAETMGVAVYLGVMVSVVGLFVWLHLLRTVAAPVAASVQYLQPVFGVAVASMMFGDRLGPHFAAGVACVLAGLALAALPRRRPDAAQACPASDDRCAARAPSSSSA